VVGPCPYVCKNKTPLGYCRTTGCINPERCNTAGATNATVNRDKLVGTLREYAEWAMENIWEVPITLPDVLYQAAEIIEKEGGENKGGTGNADCSRGEV